MALRVDPNPTIPLWWAIVLMLGLLVTVINSVGQFFTLTTQQIGIVGFVAFALTALATFLTTLEAGPVASVGPMR
jgi:membrane protein YdbS with pleckstrin-like domain